MAEDAENSGQDPSDSDREDFATASSSKPQTANEVRAAKWEASDSSGTDDANAERRPSQTSESGDGNIGFSSALALSSFEAEELRSRLNNDQFRERFTSLLIEKCHMSQFVLAEALLSVLCLAGNGASPAAVLSSLSFVAERHLRGGDVLSIGLNDSLKRALLDMVDKKIELDPGVIENAYCETLRSLWLFYSVTFGATSSEAADDDDESATSETPTKMRVLDMDM